VDVYTAPYHKCHRYWTGFGLLIRCFLFTIFGTSSDIQSNLLWIILAVLFVLNVRLLAQSSIYKNKAVDVLEITSFLNLGLLAIVLHHRNTLCHVLNISAAISLSLFLIILVYHVHIEVEKIISGYAHLIKIMKRKFVKKSAALTKQDVVTAEDFQQPPTVSTSYVELRETLIAQ